MEQQEAKKRKVTRQPKPTSSLPLDLTSEILLRLPAKHVVRSRCVSKLWSAITTDPCFTNSFNTRCYSTRLSVLIFFKKGDTLFVSSVPQDHQDSNESYNTSSSMPIARYRMKSPKHSYFSSATESVHGLICFQDSGIPIIWNPTMRQFLTLPKPEETWEKITCLLGYDPIQGKHKVICMRPNRVCDECKVFTLGSGQQSWEMIKTNHKHIPNRGWYGNARCINGVLYYKARIHRQSISVGIIMRFEVRSEKLDVITLPKNVVYNGMLIPYEGRLACVVDNYTHGGITLWIWKDGEKHEWSRKHFVAPIQHYDLSLETRFHLGAITHAGEFIYIPRFSHKTFYILYFDPKRKSFRRVEFADEESSISNRLGNILLDKVHSCTDHIESLVSL